jgi:hypothetical protein
MDAARSSNTEASSFSFCNDPVKGAAVLQRAMQGLFSSQPSPQQLQQIQKHGEAHKFVMQADKLRFSSAPKPKEAAALYKKAGEMGSASGQMINYAQMI